MKSVLAPVRRLLLVVLLAAALAGALQLPDTSPPLCERQECTCGDDVVQGRGVHVSCAFSVRQSGQVVSMNASSLPAGLQHLSVSGGGQVEVRLLQTAFSRLPLLERVSFARLRRLLIRHHAFGNASRDGGPGLLLEIEDCDAVVLESDAFHELRAPLTGLVARTGHVVMQGSSLSWLRALSLVDVARLELHEHAFALRDAHQRGGPLATVLLQNVVLAEVPRHAFPSSLADVLVVGSEIRALRRDAFSALQMRAVRILDTAVHRVDGGAFSPRTLLASLELRGARLHQVSSGAVCAAVTNLTISHSKLWEVLGGAFNLTVAAVSVTHSVLDRVRSRGFVLNKWNSMELHNNTFAWLERYAFTAPFHPFPEVDAFQFRFTGNVVGNAMLGAFGFAAVPEEEDDEDQDSPLGPRPFLPADVRDNVFEKPCHCHMREMLTDLVSIQPGLPLSRPTGPWITGDMFFNTSSCFVDAQLSRCFGLPEGFVSMANFTSEVCATERRCEGDERGDGQGSVATPHEPRPSIFEAGDIEPIFEAGLEREKKVLASIFIVVVASLSLVLALSAAAWLARKGRCGRKLGPPPCPSRLCTALCSRLRVLATDSGAGGGLVSASSARSISRLSVHEYVRQHATGTGVTTLTLHDEDQPQKVLDDDWIPCEDKATQTLPEELTQELLQTLREKLEDPENYSEARDMIEHLYDLIKVEESCNSNHQSLPSLRFDELDTDNELDDEATTPGENVYDVIRPKRALQTRPRGLHTNRSTASVGTRAPSPDKLMAPGKQGSGASGASGPPHVYSELPGREGRPAAGMLRSIGQSLASLHNLPHGSGPLSPFSPLQRPALVLCDYSEPTDAKVHVYSELPGPQGPSEAPTAPCSPAPCRMANRPLPTKPS